MRYWFSVAAIILSAWLTPPALAADRDLDECENTKDANRSIAACTRLIESGREVDHAYYSRGLAYGSVDNDRAIADLTAAIRLNPKYPFYYFVRGVIYLNQGDYDRGIADFTVAIRNDSTKRPAYFRSRSEAYRAKGDAARALADHNEYVRLRAEFERRAGTGR
ncbi:tetratricopeptide repeat protein [Methylocystis sp.]|uniref:tetratricopeptide repeat protein n=1 Tax=Methylocystis sp. TaxID=1911079 RepID=UPI003DA36568